MAMPDPASNTNTAPHLPIRDDPIFNVSSPTCPCAVTDAATEIQCFGRVSKPVAERFFHPNLRQKKETLDPLTLTLNRRRFKHALFGLRCTHAACSPTPLFPRKFLNLEG
jgi:hypothetical protein